MRKFWTLAALVATALFAVAVAFADDTTPQYPSVIQRVVPYRQFHQPQSRLEECVTAGGLTGGGDGGVGIIAVVDGTRYRVQSSADMCWTTNGAITACTATNAVAPHGERITGGVPEEVVLTGTGVLPDSGVAAAPIVYMRSVSGTGCLQMVPMLPR